MIRNARRHPRRLDGRHAADHRALMAARARVTAQDARDIAREIVAELMATQTTAAV